MSNKIDLKPPYSSVWKTGYLVINRDGRRTLILIGQDGKAKSSTQYARYLLSVKLSRFLTSEETVDHIDNDKTNDDVSNLQLMSRRENVRKSCKLPDVSLVCPVCNTIFTKSLTDLRGRKHKVVSNTISCSRSCGSKLKKVMKDKFNNNS